LLALFTVAVFFALKTSDDPALFKNPTAVYLFQKLPIGNDIVSRISTGFMVSFVFYLIVVWFPERRHKNLIKKNIKEQYRLFKEDTISILLLACQGSYNSDLPKTLAVQSEFKKYFKEAVNASQNRWDAVLNGLNDEHLKDLLVELEILMNEVSYVLSNVKINDVNVMFFFKNLSQTVYKLKNTTIEDDLSQLFRFLWMLFTGWSWTGVSETDPLLIPFCCKFNKL
jgi:hypothetical protein